MSVLGQVCRDQRITLEDAAELAKIQNALRSRCESLPPSVEDTTWSMDHSECE
jgi:hypothetical protein